MKKFSLLLSFFFLFSCSDKGEKVTEEEVDNGKGVTEEVWVELQNDLFSNSNFFS